MAKTRLPGVTRLQLPSKAEELLKLLGEAGLTNEEIAPFFGLQVGQFQDVLRLHSDLADILEAAKQAPNKKVEAALYRRALGFQTKEVHKVEGKPVKVIIKELAPDVVADIFWLKNRDPKRWRDTIDMQFTLRDRLGRAHDALRMGHTPGPKLIKGGNGEDTDD